MSWLSDFVYQHRELEAPQSFYYWAGLTSISACVKDSIWLPRHIYKLYPNIYTMLHAESGLKKGPPINAAKQLVKAVNNTKIITGRGSIQGILKEMAQANTIPGGKINMKSTVFICSSELSSSIVEDKVATKILTDLFDRNYNEGEWKSLLKMETFTLKDPTITMFTATNEAMSEDFFTRSAIQGGYYARTFIVHEKRRNRPNSLLVPLDNEINYISSANYLKEVAKLSGPFELLGSKEESEIFKYKIKNKNTGRDEYFTQAGVIYEEWYNSFLDAMDNNEQKDVTGTLNRFGDSVLKVAMILALAREPKLVIGPDAMEEAITVCTRLLGNIQETTMGKYGISSAALLKSLIIKELLERDTHQVSRTILMKKMWMHFSTPEEFDEIMLSFDQAGMISTGSVGNQILYTMPESQAIELQRFFLEKKK